jgi:hypothetical protein
MQSVGKTVKVLEEISECFAHSQDRRRRVQTSSMRYPMCVNRAARASAFRAIEIAGRQALESRGEPEFHGGPRRRGNRSRTGAMGTVGTN